MMVGAWVRKATGLRCNLHIGLLILALAGAASAQERTYWYPTADRSRPEALSESRTFCAVLFDAARASRQALVGSVIGGAAVAPEPVVYRPREGVAVFRIVGSFAEAQASLRKGVGQNGVTAVLRVFDTAPKDPPVVEWDRLLIGFRPGADRVALYRKYGLDPIRSLVVGYGDIVQVRMQSAADVGPTALANQIAENERGTVEFVHVDYLSSLRKLGRSRAPATKAGIPLFVPNDPLYAQQWHLNNTGQGGGTVGADVRAEAAWDISRGDPSVIIAVIDDSCDITHEDLNVGGKIVSPRDVSDGSSNPGPKYAEDGHGTCVSGVATAAGNNSLGVTGIAPNCRLMPIRMDFGTLPYSNIVDAFDWARANGAWCANNSWYRGSGTTPAAISASISALATGGRGGLGSPVLFASGNYNDGYGIDTGNTDRWWPQNLASAVWCVGATTNYDLQCDYSDTGDNVQIMTPSGDGGGSLGIMTTDNMGSSGYAAGNYYDHFNGTSSACPLATGIVGLIMSVNPVLTRSEVLSMLTSTAKKLDPAVAHYDSNGHSRIYGYGRADAAAALLATAATLGVKATVNVSTLNTGAGGRKTDSANPIPVTYTLMGRTRTATVFDGTPRVLSCDKNSTVTFPAVTTGTTQRWARAAAYSYTVGTSDCTVPTVDYYHQLKRPLKVLLQTGATALAADNTVTAKYYSLATEQTLSLAEAAQSVFADTGSQATFQSPSSKSGDTERWASATTQTVTINSTTPECNAQFYHQVAARVRLNGTSSSSYVATSQRSYFGVNDSTTKQSNLYGIYQFYCDVESTLGFEQQSTGSPLLAASGDRAFRVVSGLDAQVNYLIQARYDTSSIEVSRTNSTTTGATVTAPANGRTAIRVTVTVKDSSKAPLAGVSSDRVDVFCTPNSGVTITKPTATTDSTGRLSFEVVSQQPGPVTFTATLDAQQLSATATAEFLGVMTMRVPQAGAYLVTFPITPADTNQTIADFGVTPQPAQLAWWNHDTGVYDVYRPGTSNDTLRIMPGKGYFLRTDAAGTIDLTGTHMPAGTTTFSLVTSPKGFHLLGNPKETGPMIWSLGDFEVIQGGVSKGRLSDSATWSLIDPMAWTFNGRTYELVADALFPGTTGLRTQIAVFEGFYWYAKQDGVGIVYHADHSRTASRPATITPSNFGLSLVATSADVKATVLVGSRSQALRVAAAPVAPDGDDLRLDVVNTDGTRAGADFIGRPVTQATSWLVTATTRAADRDVVLSWPQLTRQLPPGFRARLVDLTSGQSLLLNTHTTYTYRSNGERQFRISVVPQREAGLQIVDFQPAASRGRSVSFRATVTGEAELSLRVLSLSGRVVAEGRPVTGSGDTALVWDGLDSAGRPVPRGTYQVQLVARNAEGETVRATRIVNLR